MGKVGKGQKMSLDVKDNTQEFLSAFESAKLRGLERIGEAAEGYAVDLCPVDTGNLRNSITHIVDGGGDAVYIGSNVDYAGYV